MKSKINTYLLYPLIILSFSIIKGIKKEYKNFFQDSSKKPIKDDILKVNSKNFEHFSFIESFFDKTVSMYKKVLISFEIDLNTPPETKKYYKFDFLFILKFFFAMSTLGKKVPNKNLDVSFEFNKHKFYDENINNLLRYIFLAYGSQRVECIYFDKDSLKDEKSKLAYETMLSYLDGATLINFSNQRHLYVLTCEKSGKKFDIVWSSGKDIELTDFNDVFDKYGKLMKKDIKISNSPIYALHK